MGRIYRIAAATEPLAQGDIFSQIPFPIINFRDGVHLEHAAEGMHQEAPVGESIRDGMRFLAEVELVDAIVLEQSCDTLRGRQVTLAPLTVCDMGKRKSAKDQWDYIKRIGQSLAEPSRLYLTSDAELAFPRRIVDLSSKFHLTPEDLSHFIRRGRRAATLTDKGLVNLQHRLTVQLSRVARDDVDWLSEEDLLVKVEALTADAEKLKRSVDTKKSMLATAVPGSKKEDLEAELEVAVEDLGHLTDEIQVAENALAAARRDRTRGGATTELPLGMMPASAGESLSKQAS